MTEYIFKPISWDSVEMKPNEDYENGVGKVDILVGGITRDHRSIQLIVEGFRPYAYIELPESVRRRKNAKSIISELKIKLQNLVPGLRCIQHGKMKRFLYSDERVMIYVNAPSMTVLRSLNNVVKRLDYVNGFSFRKWPLKVHEVYGGLDAIVKYTAIHDIPTCDWVSAMVTVATPPIACADITGIIHYDKLKRYQGKEIRTIIQPRYLSFDIECYSKNHDSKIPNASIFENCINQIGLVVGRMDGSVDRKICLTLGDPTNKHRDYEMVTFWDDDDAKRDSLAMEKRLLIRFVELVKEINPDILTGFNIMAFDYDYIITRMQRHGILNLLFQLSRYEDYPGSIGTVSWTSSAYGTQSYQYPVIPGIIHVDMKIEVERVFKFAKYSLDYVSGKLLNEHKDDLSPRELFMFWKITLLYYQLFRTRTPITDHLASGMTNTIAHTIMNRHRTHGTALKYRKKILDNLARPDRYNHTGKYIRDLMGVMADYCIQDCVLPIKIAKYMDLWASMSNMAHVMCVPVQFLTTRGQTIRAVAQMIRLFVKKGIVIQADGFHSSHYQGATVITATPGCHDLVATLDFGSLYPSIMQSNNISPDTLCRAIPGHVYKITDENRLRYRDISVEEHVGCEHDMKRRTPKHVLCNSIVYRYKRIQYTINEDGTFERHDVGLIPMITRKLASERKRYKTELKNYTEKAKQLEAENADPQEIEYNRSMATISDKLQQAVKVSSNSVYGVNGNMNGMLSCTAVAASVTCIGRKSLELVEKCLVEIMPNIRIIYGDTDSVMVSFKDTDREETFRMAHKAADVATHIVRAVIVGVEPYAKMRLKNLDETHFTIDQIAPTDTIFKDICYEDQCAIIEYSDSPMVLEMEYIADRFFLKTKKRYTARVINEKGEKIDEINKGTIVTRRDTCMFAREIYRRVDEAVIENTMTYTEIIDMIASEIKRMYSGRVSADELVIYTSISTLVNYAKNKKDPENNANILYFITKDKTHLTYDATLDPFDPRLDYRSCVQSSLGLKLLRRGVKLPANTRLAYIYLDYPFDETHRTKSDKVEDYEYYCEYKDQLPRPDYDYYVKSLSGTTGDKQVMESIHVRFPQRPIYYFGPPDGVFKNLLGSYIDSTTDMYTTKLASIIYSVNRCTVFNVILYDRAQLTTDPIVESATGAIIATQSIDSSASITALSYLSFVSKPSLHGTMIHSWRARAKQMAVIYYSRFDQVNNIFSEPLFDQWPSLLSVAHTVVSISVLDRISKSHHVPKRTRRKQAYSGRNLLANNMRRQQVMLTSPIDEFEAFTPIYIIDRTPIPGRGKLVDEPIPPGTVIPDTDSDFTYTIVDTKGTIKKSNIYRESIITYVRREEEIITTIGAYHQTYHQLKNEFYLCTNNHPSAC